LHEIGHNVYSIHEEMPGSSDDEVIKKSVADSRILITNDKDFGEKVYRQGYNHVGIILLRLVNERSSNKIAVLKQFLESYSNQIDNNFIVVNEGQVRFAKRK